MHYMHKLALLLLSRVHNNYSCYVGHTAPPTIDTSGCQSLHIRSLVLKYSIMSCIATIYIKVKML